MTPIVITLSPLPPLVVLFGWSSVDSETAPLFDFSLFADSQYLVLM